MKNSKNGFKRNMIKLSTGAFIFAFALIFSAYTNAGKARQTTYHIVSETATTYNVTTDGVCEEGSDPCQFTTDLPPNSPGVFNKSTLELAGVEIQEGSFQP